MNEAAIKLEGVRKEYWQGGKTILALSDLHLAVPKGSLTAIIGPSGCGKTTLLNVIGTLDRTSAGKVWVDGVDVATLKEAELTQLRRSKLGFIFQQFNLIPNLSALENVMVPMEFAGVPGRARKARALELLQQVGLPDRASHTPARLSGGEQQRVAIARALANDPGIILADEPTGNLDSATGEQIVLLLKSLSGEMAKTVVVVTHNEELAKLADLRVYLRDGRITRSEVASGSRSE